jgi:hypothetical protein
MTLFTDVISSFYHYIENDVDFFNYFELDEDECMEVAGQRAEVLLTEAASYISRKLIVESVFSNTIKIVPDGDTEEVMAFAETLNNMEINLLVKAMFLTYLQRDLTMLRTFHGVMTSSDLNMYSPANERKTFVAMVQQYEDNLKIEISEYQMYDRTSGSFVQICE